MSLPEPHRSRAVLFGAATYSDPTTTDLPAVARSLNRLGELLTDPAVWGLPPEHCKVIVDPKSPEVVLDAIHAATQKATDTLLVYYAGHGQLNKSDLLLMLPSAELSKPYLSVAYDQVRDLVIQAHRCPSKVVILDCCFSGKAMIGGMAGTGLPLADRAAVDGTCLVTAVAETKEALSPPGETYTAFTGELLTLLENGVADGPAYLTAESLYWTVHRELLAKGRPEPQIRERNGGAKIVLARNRWRSQAAPEIVRAAPAPPPDWVMHLPMAPAELLAEVRGRRLAGVNAIGVLEAVGRYRRGQTLAALLAELDGADRGEDLRAVLGGLADRDLSEVQEVLTMLMLLDLGNVVDQLLAAIATGHPERTAQLVSALLQSDAGHAEILIDRAIAASRGRPRLALDLVSALLIRDLQGAAEHALRRVAVQVEGAEAMWIADALREAGRDQAAYLLYARAIDAVAQRPADEIAAIADGLCRHGMSDVAEGLALAAVTSAKSLADFADLICALVATTSFTQVTERVRRILAEALDPGPVTTLAGLLWQRADDDEAVRLLAESAASRPVAVAVGFVNHLVGQGRPIDAFDLLDAVVPKRSAVELDELTRAVVDTPQRSRCRRALAGVPTDPPDVAVELYALLHAADDGRSAIWRAELTGRPQSDLIEVIAGLARGGSMEFAVELLRATASRTLDSSAAVAAIRSAGSASVSAMILVAAHATDQEELLTALLAHLGEAPSDEIGRMVDVLPADASRRLAAAVAAQPLGFVYAVLAALPRSQQQVVTGILSQFRDSHRDDLEPFELAAALRRRGELRDSELLLSGRIWLPAEAAIDPLAASVAEILHDARIPLGNAYRYPIDHIEAAKHHRFGSLTEGDICLLILRWPGVTWRERIVFTQSGVVHGSGNRIAYTDLVAVRGIVEVDCDVMLTPEAPANGRPVTLATSCSPEAELVVGLLRTIQRAAQYFAERSQLATQRSDGR